MNILQAWPAIVFGWPAILVSIALSVMGIAGGRPKWLFAAAIIALPFSLYLAGSPAFRWFGLVFPFLLVGAGIFIRHRHTTVAWFLLAPFVGVSGWLAILVMNQ